MFQFASCKLNFVLLECQKYPRSRKSRRKLVSSFRRSFKGKCPSHCVRLSSACPQVRGPCPVTVWPLMTIISPPTPGSGQPRRTEERVSKFWLEWLTLDREYRDSVTLHSCVRWQRRGGPGLWLRQRVLCQPPELAGEHLPVLEIRWEQITRCELWTVCD